MFSVVARRLAGGIGAPHLVSSQLFENLQRGVGVSHQIILPGEFLCGLAKTGAMLRYCQIIEHIDDEPGVIGAWQDEAVFIIRHDLGSAVLGGSNNGQSGGKRFERDVGKWIVKGGQEEDVCRRVNMRHGDRWWRIDDDEFCLLVSDATHRLAGDGVALAFASRTDEEDDEVVVVQFQSPAPKRAITGAELVVGNAVINHVDPVGRKLKAMDDLFGDES